MKIKETLQFVGPLVVCWSGLSAVFNSYHGNQNDLCEILQTDISFRSAPLEMILYPDVPYVLSKDGCPLGYRLK
jgi:hypothetical protein